MESLKELKIRVFRNEMDRVGYVSKNFTDKEIETMAIDAFKGFNGKQVASFGAQLAEDDEGNIITERVKGQIRKTQREQIESFQLSDRTFGQQIAADNIKRFYGYDVFEMIRTKGIRDYNLSNNEYVDPETGDTLTFTGRL